MDKAKTFDELRQLVVDGATNIYKAGLVQFGEGNVSVRIPGKNEMLISPTMNDYDRMNLGDVVHLTFDGTQLSAGKKASSEYRLHVGIYQARPLVQCVIHTHSPYASMFSIARKPIPVIYEEMVIFLGGTIPIAPFGRANTEEITAAAIGGMGDKNAVLMANHGVLVCGRSMEYAVRTADRVEKMARVYAGALQIGQGSVFTIEESACDQFRSKFDENFGTAPSGTPKACKS
jgi:L-ribulose-5-phosphate 4-epimerase